MSGKIDSDALVEWILSKAHKTHGVAVESSSVGVVKDAVERAIAASSDEIHVTCELKGASGPVQIAEYFTRTAAENLFPFVAHAHEAKQRERQWQNLEATPVLLDSPRVRIWGIDRGIFIGLVVLMLVFSFVAFIVAEERGPRDEEHNDKHEMRH